MKKSLFLNLAALVALVAVSHGRVEASPFTPGDLAVFQADSATANNTTFSIVEVSSTVPGGFVQSFPISATGASALRTSGSATSTGYLSSSNDRSLLSFTAHNSATTSGNANALLPRGVGTLDAAGNFALQTTYTGTSGSQTRSATSLDNSTWYIGDQSGIYTNGTTSASPTGNIRSVKSFGGSVYGFIANASIQPVSTISAPSGGALNALPGLASASSNNQDFYMLSSGLHGSAFDILYILSATSNTAGSIEKYSLVNDLWTPNGTLANSNAYTTTFGGFGLAAQTSGTGAVLYITSGQGALAANSLLAITDTAGWNATINISGSPTTLYTAAPGTTIKGVELAPVPEPGAIILTLAAMLGIIPFVRRRRLQG